MNLVMLHGRAQQGRDPKLLREQWWCALHQAFSLLGIIPKIDDIVFPFYGDDLDNLMKQVDDPETGVVRKRGTGADKDVLLLENEIASELAAIHRLPQSAIDAEYTGDVREKGPLNWEWVHSILRALDKTKAGPWAIDTFTHDVAVYLNYDAVRQKIQEIVSNQIPEGNCVFVSHSLGTIVAYDLLSKKGRIGVSTFVTIGSPLGLRSIKAKLGTLVMPASVRGVWYNAFDDRDVVALIPLDRANFAITPPIQNERVMNPDEDRHSITGYLSIDRIASQIAAGLA